MKAVYGIPEQSLILSYRSIIYNFLEEKFSAIFWNKVKVSEIKIN